ncbi:MAG: LssY C-terminal domain-containing protein [Planctomycetia bacterium]|nr:LssY C-terminal domain-containing protein [Planctomycetia bacterium]
MSTVSEISTKPADVIPHESVRRRAGLTLAALLGFYFVVAYLMMPALWEHYVHAHPLLEDVPTIVYTTTGIPGDPLNVALIGTETEVKKIILKAGWYPADPLTLKSCLEIAEATVLKRSYDEAPVSSLYYEKRKEDLAFEQPVGPDPRERHHVRFWRTTKHDTDGRPVWIGSATFDRRVGLSHTTGEITHHIAADVDAERDHLMANLQATGDLEKLYSIPNFHKVKSGRNGGGDPWHTDGALRVGIVKP